MRLYKMVLYNFRQYRKREVIKVVNEGLVGVLGKNGAGKSTLFNAIGWCLYGKVKGVTKDQIMNLEADKKEECYVELYFELNGVKFHAKRDIKRTDQCFVKTADGTPYAIGTSNLTSYVEENLFKMDYDAFCACYYAEQDDFDNLVKLQPAKRVQTVSKLLRIESIDAAAKNTRKELSDLNREIDEARKHIRNEDVLRTEKKQINSSIQSLHKTQATIEKEIKTIDASYKEALAKKATGDQDYQKHKDLLHQSFIVKEKIETLIKRSLEPNEKELTSLLSLKKRFLEIEQYKELYQKLKIQKEEMSNARVDFKEKSNLEKEMQSLSSEIERYTKEKEQLLEALTPLLDIEEQVSVKEKDMESLHIEINNLRDIFQEKKFAMKSKMEKVEELKTLKLKFDEMGTDSPCPTCERPLGEHYEDKMSHIKEEGNALYLEAKQLQEEYVSIEKNGKEKNDELKLLTNALSVLRSLLLKKGTMSERSSILEKEITSRKSRLDGLSSSIEPLKEVSFDEEKYSALSTKVDQASKLYEEILRIESSVSKIPQLEEIIEEVRAEIANAEELEVKIKNELTSLNFDEEGYKQFDHLSRNLQEQLQTKKDEKTEAEYTIKSLEKDILIIDEKLVENENTMNEIKEKEEQMMYLGKLDEAYKQYKSDILSKLAPTLSEIMTEDIEILTNGKYNQVELDDEYNIYIYRNGKKQPLNFYSGGERKLAALCLRLAISSLLVSQTGQASFDMLAMDEVFGSMDNERQDSMIEMLRNLNKKFPQILMVTHSEHVKELFDHVIEIHQDGEGNSHSKWLTDWDISKVDSLLEEYESVEETS